MKDIVWGLVCLALLAAVFPGFARAMEPDALADARRFIAAHEAEVRPVEKAFSLAWWQANVGGKDADFKAKEEAQNRLDALLANPDKFAALKSIRQSLAQLAKPADPVLVRQIEVLYLQYLEKQVDPALLQQMSAKGNAIEKAFNQYRAKVNGQEMTDSQVRKALKESKDSQYLRSVWEAGKAVGPTVEADLKELVKLRNQAARKLGFRDFHVLQLALGEQRQEDVLKLFDEIDRLITPPFTRMKAEIDAQLAARFGVAAGELKPWHYQDPFFQEAPAIGDTDFDAVYAHADILALAKRFYTGIGLPIDDVIARSDLYEKPGKSPHAFCTDIDREGDVRVLANIVPNEYWMNTMLHELGHSVYSSKNIPATVPYVLRCESHTLCTEGLAMMFQGFAHHAGWLGKMGVPVADPKAFDAAGAHLERHNLLIFAAWCQVMFRFEKELYANPDQDLNKLWWDLVERYQHLQRPAGRNAPDYAAKIHIVSSPAYYHNYLLGQLFASQLHHAIAREVLRTEPAKALYNDRPEVGAFLKTKVFAPGRTLSWNALTRFATGADLSAAAFAQDLSGE
jgi:peptidyl-dipeptidase A